HHCPFMSPQDLCKRNFLVRLAFHHDVPVAHLQLLRFCLKHRGCCLEDLPEAIPRCQLRRLPGDVDHPVTVAPRVEWRGLGIPTDHLNLFHGNTQHLCRHHRNRGATSGTDVCGAEEDDNRTILVDLDDRATRTSAAVSFREGHPDPAGFRAHLAHVRSRIPTSPCDLLCPLPNAAVHPVVSEPHILLWSRGSTADQITGP